MGFFGPDGEPTVHRDKGYAKEIRGFDATGRGAGVQYAAPDRKPLIVASLGYARVSRLYDDHGRVVEESFFDNADKQELVPGKGYARVQRSHDKQGRLYRETFLGADGERTTTVLGFAERQLMHVGDSHRVRGEVFLGPQGRPAFHRDGYVEIQRTRDPVGREILVRTLDALGNPAADRDGAAERISVYEGDHLVRLITKGTDGEPVAAYFGTAGFKRTYDAAGRLAEETTLDEGGLPTVDRQTGCATVRSAYDAAGGLVSQRCHGPGDALMTGNDGWAVREYLRDGRGRVSRVTLRDASGEVARGPDGWAEELRVYDARDRLVGRAFLGPDGDPVQVREGYAGVKLELDALGRVAKETYLDAEGVPVRRSDGWTTKQVQRDPAGRILEVAYFDAEGQPASAGGVTLLRRRYGPAGQLEHEAYVGPDGKPTRGPEGYASMRVEVDELGREQRRMFYDERGMPGHPTEGFAIRQSVLDRYGRLRQVITLDEAGRRANRKGPLGRVWASQRISYDHLGNRVEETWFDATDRPAAGPEGAHRSVWSWDERGQLVSQQRFGTDGGPLRGGWARQAYAYDRHGRLVSISYQDIMGRPAPVWNGVGRVELTYSGAGDLLSMTYLDTKAKPMNGRPCYPGTWCEKRNVARARYVYDGGKLSEMRLYDLGDSQTATLDCGRGNCF